VFEHDAPTSMIEALGFLAAALVFGSFCMKRMIPLRLAAIASNVAFIAYGALAGLTPILTLHLVLLPLNMWRTAEMVRMMRRVQGGAEGRAVADWLKPYARRALHPAGAVIFRKGDTADRIFFVVRGTVRIDEVGVLLGPRSVFGEMGMFSTARRRTQSATAIEPVELLWVGERDLALICHQHPELSVYLIRLVTNRLVSNAEGVGGSPTVGPHEPAVGSETPRADRGAPSDA
jgi:hypothetical protein